MPVPDQSKASRREFLAAATVAAGVPLLAGAQAPPASSRPAAPVHATAAAAAGMVTVGRENSTPIDLYVEDHGSGRPVVLLHGWPLAGTAFEKQVPALLAAGHRVITYDMRGFGRSSQPATGYDFATLADDLHNLMARMDLRDAALVGHSLGTGEVATYIGRYGTARVRKAVLISALPFFLRTPDNPAGVDPAVVDQTQRAILADRPAFLTGLFKNFYNADVNLGRRVSPEVLQGNWNTAYAGSAIGTHAVVASWREDLRPHLPRIDVPTLVIHGGDDRILPHATTAVPTTRAIRGARLVTVAGGPHLVPWTHGDEVNRALVEFLA
jgi:pimeloyl-ACP methyl ester carboxylesterase